MKLRFFSLFCILYAFFLIGCSEKSGKSESSELEKDDAILSFNTENLDTLIGTYLGDFGGEDIRITLTHVGKNHIVGFNLLKGLRRNISGTYVNKGDTIEMILSEPGDNEFDGVFELSLLKSNFSIEGKWHSNSKKIASKSFKLEKILDLDFEETPSKFDNSNFTNYFYMVEDSLGTINFDSDGSCNYTYYPSLDDINRVEQLVEIKGSWSIKNQLLKINWQPNSVFPSRQSSFKIKTDDYEYILDGEGRSLRSMMY